MIRFYRLLILCFLLAGCRQAKQAPARLAASTEAATKQPEAAETKRPVFTYSVVNGGAYSAAEVKRAKAADPIVASHYHNIRPEALKPLRLTADTAAYVSYRVGKLIFWTSHRVNLKKGELVLSDGNNWVRGRCGNLIAETPQLPVLTPLKLEPQASLMDVPTTLMSVQPYPAAEMEALSVTELEDLPSARHIQLPTQPNLPLMATPLVENNDWAPVVAGSGTPLVFAPASGATPPSNTPGSASTTYPTPGSVVNPFLPANPLAVFVQPLPPIQSLLIPPATVTFWPGTYTPAPENPTPARPLIIAGYPPANPQPPNYIPPTGPPPTIWTPPYQPPAPPNTPPDAPPSTPPGTPPSTPPDAPPGQPTPPPEFPPPDTPPQLSTPEPATIAVTGLSLLVLVGYYLLARKRFH